MFILSSFDFLDDDEDDDDDAFWRFLVDAVFFFLEVLVDADFAGFDFEADVDDDVIDVWTLSIPAILIFSLGIPFSIESSS